LKKRRKVARSRRRRQDETGGRTTVVGRRGSTLQDQPRNGSGTRGEGGQNALSELRRGQRTAEGRIEVRLEKLNLELGWVFASRRGKSLS